MGYMNEFPHSKMFDSDLREIVTMYIKLKDLPSDWEQFKKEIGDDWESLKTFVNNYFDELDVQKEINAKIDSLIADGTMADVVYPIFMELNNEITVLKAMMNEISKLEDGSTTGDAELVNARIDHAGKVWDNVGENIRHFSKTVDDFDKETTNCNIEWRDGYYNESGKFTEDTTYKTSQIISATKNSLMKIYVDFDTVQHVWIHYFDNNQNYMRKEDYYGTASIDISNITAGYIAVEVHKANIDKITVTVKGVLIALKDSLVERLDVREHILTPNWEEGEVDHKTGELLSAPNYRRTEFIKTDEMCITKIKNTFTSPQYIWIDEYDLNKKYIRTLTYRQLEDIELNSSTGYAIIEAHKNQFGNIQIYGSTIKYLENMVKGIEKVNSYYLENGWLEEKLAEIREQTRVTNGISFAFLTDMHFASNSLQSKYLVKEILDNTTIPFAICGGDFPVAYGTEEEVEPNLKQLVEYQNYIGKHRFFSVRGNHDFWVYDKNDTDIWYEVSESATYDAIIRNSEFTVNSIRAGKFYYYIDIDAQKTRIFMLSSVIYTEDKGVVYGMEDEQIEWLLEKVQERDGWRYIFVSHIPADNYITSYSDTQLPLHEIMSAINNKKSFNDIDFSTTTNEVVCHIVGHNHKDESHIKNNVLTISTVSDAHYTDGGWDRTIGTVNEQAIDVFTFDYDKRAIKAKRIGGGADREFNY